MYKTNLTKSITGEACIQIARPIDVVFDFVVLHFFDNYPRWALEVIEFKAINSNPMQVGALAKQTKIEYGQKVETTFEVMTVQDNELFILNGLSAPFINTYHFQSIHGDEATLLTFSVEIMQLEVFMWPFIKLLHVAIEEGAQNSINNIKGLLEEECVSEMQ